MDEIGLVGDDDWKFLEGTERKKSKMNFEQLKEKKIVYVMFGETIEDYDVSKHHLFDIGGMKFSNGFGGSWYYSDYGKTWSFVLDDLVKNKFNQYSKDHHRWENIKRVWKSDLSKDNKAKLTQALTNGFYATMYGEHYCKDSQTIYLNGEDVALWSAFEMCYVWGWPGPDFSIYKVEDYGLSWVLDEKDWK